MGASVDTVTPTRRTVVRSAAWSVPVVAASIGTPAFAASPCATSYPWRLDWGNNTTDDAFTTTYSVVKPPGANTVHIGTAVVTGPPGTSPVTVTFKNSVVGADRRTATNLEVENTTDIGALGAQERGLLLWNTDIVAGRDASRQVVEVSFSRVVTDLRFTITDIDSNNQFGSGNDYRDQVELTGLRTAVATRRGRTGFYVEGAGTPSSPWQMYDDDVPADDSSDDRGNLAITYPGPVSGFQLDYWNAAGRGQQAIFLSDLTFDALGC
jgi:hypothetical protein